MTVAAPAPEVPSRYELLLELASGGMGAVYVGLQRGAGGFERVVAIKRMHAELAADAELGDAFLDEARIASLIRHPNVVSVLDVHSEGGEHLLVMDYIEGASLAGLVSSARQASRRIPRAVALRVVVEALHGLHAAHEQVAIDGTPLGIVHRDATPQNILIGVDGSVRIADFGVARAAQRMTRTETGAIKGKLKYMSPEQARAEHVDRRTDVYAIGVVLWELLAGETMHTAKNEHELLVAAVRGDVRSLAGVAAGTPPALDAIVMRALAPDRAQRWSTAQELADVLEAWAVNARELASAKDVAELLEAQLGGLVRRRRAALQTALEGPRGSVARAPTSSMISAIGTPGAVSAPRDTAPPRRRALGLVIAVSVTGLVGAFFAVRALATSPGSAPASTSAGAPAASSAPAPAPTPPAVAPARRVRISLRSASPILDVRADGIDDVRFDEGGATFTLPHGDRPVHVTARFGKGEAFDRDLVPDTDAVLQAAAPAVAPTQPEPKPAKPGGNAAPRATGGALRPSPY